MTFDIPVPWLPANEVRVRAEQFLSEKHPSGQVPVPVELIVEKMGIDIVPSSSLQKLFDLVACTSADLKTIYVDRFVYERRENRYRYTLAHELGHVVLHPQLFGQLLTHVRTVDSWLTLIRQIPPDIYSRVEWQAYAFGGFLLVPTDPLLVEYARALTDARAGIARALESGVAREACLGPAWDSLCQQIADPFNVSKRVIEKRLNLEGYTADSI